MSAVFVWKHTLWSDRTRHTQKAAGLASEASYSIKTRCVKRKCKTNHLWCWCRGGGKMSIIRISLQLPCRLAIVLRHAVLRGNVRLTTYGAGAGVEGR